MYFFINTKMLITEKQEFKSNGNLKISDYFLKYLFYNTNLFHCKEMCQDFRVKSICTCNILNVIGMIEIIL